ncbi:flagellar export chaperone FliS [Allopontixanthobacter sediminis]|uniref:Flagellin n=1 Tax=Allopontixanthobacter sediminis TaxID=1689985 RepID=A0A845B3H2_9SPHN|nr:flagellar protein FliS [Allopontixanthobacter sediminis]MXP44940.1 flagellin [Allopontixanthobacter sediminis]
MEFGQLMARVSPARSPAEAYRRVQMDARIFGSDAPALVRLCLEEACSALGRSIYAARHGHNDLRQRALARALDAVAALRAGLNRDSELAEAFTTIYDHAENSIRQAMLKFDSAKIAAMLGDLEDIRIAFRPG